MLNQNIRNMVNTSMWTHKLIEIWNLHHCIKGITLTVEGKCTKCTRVHKATLCEKFQSVVKDFKATLVTYRLYTYVMHFIYLSYGNSNAFPNNNVWRTKFDLKSSTIFSIKPLKTWLTHLHEHITSKRYGICVTVQWYYTNCIREIY